MTTHPITHDPAAVDNPILSEWLTDFDSVGKWLHVLALAHASGNHSECDDAVTWLMLTFEDIDLGDDEALHMIASFAQMMALPEEQALRMAGRFAAYFEKEV